MKATPMMGLVALQDPRWAHPQRGLLTASGASALGAGPPVSIIEIDRRYLACPAREALAPLEAASQGAAPSPTRGGLVRLQDDQ